MVMIAMALRGGAKSKIGKARFGKCRLTITPPEFLKVRERRIFRRKKIGGRGPTGPPNPDSSHVERNIKALLPGINSDDVLPIVPGSIVHV